MIGLHQKQEERHPAHAPGIAQGDALLLDRHRMQVQEKIGEHDHDPVAPIDGHGMAEDALPDLRIANRFAEAHGVMLYFQRVIGSRWCRSARTDTGSAARRFRLGCHRAMRRIASARRTQFRPGQTKRDRSTDPALPGRACSCRLPVGRRRPTGWRSARAAAGPGPRN